jgi:hypothetical protein
MSPVWLLPGALAVLAAVLLTSWARAVRSDLAELSEHLGGLARLRERAESVQAEAARTARATERTLDALAPPARQ